MILSQGGGGWQRGQHLCLAQTLFVPFPVKVPHIPHVQSNGEWRKVMRYIVEYHENTSDADDCEQIRGHFTFSIKPKLGSELKDHPSNLL